MEYPFHENWADRCVPLVLCNDLPLSGPDPRLLFKLSMKNFLEAEKEDLNITVKQKMDALPIQNQKQIPLTCIVDKRTGSWIKIYETQDTWRMQQSLSFSCYFLKNDVWKEKNGYSGSNHVYYRYYLNSYTRYLFFMKCWYI